MYAFSENYVLPLSHDEVVHGKGSLLGKMPGDRWQQFANLRLLYAYMWAHPGKKLLFMGGEIGAGGGVEPRGLARVAPARAGRSTGVQGLVRDLNRVYRAEPALWEIDFEPAGFRWLEPNDASRTWSRSSGRARTRRGPIVCACNFSPVSREGYRLGLPTRRALGGAAEHGRRAYGGAGVGNSARSRPSRSPGTTSRSRSS